MFALSCFIKFLKFIRMVILLLIMIFPPFLIYTICMKNMNWVLVIIVFYFLNALLVGL